MFTDCHYKISDYGVRHVERLANSLADHERASDKVERAPLKSWNNR